MGCERQFTFLAGRQVNGDYGYGSHRSRYFPKIFYTVSHIAAYHLGTVQVQPALIVAIVRMARHGNIHIAEGLKGHTHVLACGVRHNLFVSQFLGFLVFALKDELAYLRQVLLGTRVDDVVGLSCPDVLFVQLDMLYGRSSENHCSHHTITHRQRLCPGHSRFVVP